MCTRVYLLHLGVQVSSSQHVNPFLPNIPFWSPWKHQKPVAFWCFQRYQYGNIEKKRARIKTLEIRHYYFDSKSLVYKFQLVKKILFLYMYRNKVFRAFYSTLYIVAKFYAKAPRTSCVIKKCSLRRREGDYSTSPL